MLSYPWCFISIAWSITGTIVSPLAVTVVDTRLVSFLSHPR